MSDPVSDRLQPPRALGCLLLAALAITVGLVLWLIIAVTSGSGDAAAWVVIILGTLVLAATIAWRETEKRADR